MVQEEVGLPVVSILDPDAGFAANPVVRATHWGAGPRTASDRIVF